MRAFLPLAFTLIGAAVSGRPLTPNENEDLALVGATVVPGPAEEPIRDGAILIREGKIAAVGPQTSIAVPATTRVIDCSGRTITAAFWNSHVHFFERKWADAANLPAAELARQFQDTLTRYGFTSVFDTGSMWENTSRLRSRVESGEVPGPRIRSTGEALLAPGAMPPARILGILGFMNLPAPEIHDATEAAAAAKRLLEQGVDAIKIHLQPPPPPGEPFPVDAIPAAVAEAHRVGKPVFVHPHNGADVLAAVRAGVDIVAHTTPGSGPWDDTILAAMKEHRVALTPTLTLWKSALRHDRLSTQEQITATAIAQLRAWLDAEGTVLFGTDLGAVDPDPAEEYELMAQAGMSFRRILDSLTTAPAERFGESKERGRIVPGLHADLVVLRTDPSEDGDIAALAAVEYTLRSGKILYRAGERG